MKTALHINRVVVLLLVMASLAGGIWQDMATIGATVVWLWLPTFSHLELKLVRGMKRILK